MKTKNLGGKRLREPYDSSNNFKFKYIEICSKENSFKKKEKNHILENQKNEEIIDLTIPKQLEVKEIRISNDTKSQEKDDKTIIINENDDNTVPNSIDEISSDLDERNKLIPYIEIIQPEKELNLFNNDNINLKLSNNKINLNSDNIQIRIKIEKNDDDKSYLTNKINFNDQIIEVSEEESVDFDINKEYHCYPIKKEMNNDKIENENLGQIEVQISNNENNENLNEDENNIINEEEESSSILNFDNNVNILNEYLKEKEGNENYPHLSHDLVIKFFQTVNGKDEIKNDLLLNQSSFKRLNKNKWLNDEIINAYGKMINIRNENNSNYPKVRIFSSFLLQKIFCLSKEEIQNDENKYKDLLQYFKKSRKQINLNNYQILLFPFNINNSHWALISIDIEKRELIYYDSLKNFNINEFIPIFENITILIDKYLIDYNDFLLHSNLNWSYNFMKNIPYQNNGSDCGVFVCQFMNYISKNKDFDFSQDDINYFRVLMGVELILGYLLSK